MDAQRLKYKAALADTGNLLAKAYKNTKRRSTVQFAQERFRVGLISKEKYTKILQREAHSGLL